jgi:hypothetical protein
MPPRQSPSPVMYLVICSEGVHRLFKSSSLCSIADQEGFVLYKNDSCSSPRIILAGL